MIEHAWHKTISITKHKLANVTNTVVMEVSL